MISSQLLRSQMTAPRSFSSSVPPAFSPEPPAAQVQIPEIVLDVPLSTSTVSPPVQTVDPVKTTPVTTQASDNKRPACSASNRLVLSPVAWLKWMYMCHAGDTEVAGFGISAADKLLYVEDIILVEQIATAATVEMTANGLANMYDMMAEANIPPSQCSRIWFHTHPGDSPHPSAVDETSFLEVFDDADWGVMAIVGKSGDTYARIRFRHGPGGQFKIPVEVDWAAVAYFTRTGDLEMAIQGWDEEYRKNVSKKVFTYTRGAGHGGYGNHYGTGNSFGYGDYYNRQFSLGTMPSQTVAHSGVQHQVVKPLSRKERRRRRQQLLQESNNRDAYMREFEAHIRDGVLIDADNFEDPRNTLTYVEAQEADPHEQYRYGDAFDRFDSEAGLTGTNDGDAHLRAMVRSFSDAIPDADGRTASSADCGPDSGFSGGGSFSGDI